MRFLFPVLPLFNLAAAAGLVRIRHRRGKSGRHRLAWLAALGMLAATAAAAMLMLYISAHNYPGGQAMYRLHKQHAPGGSWWGAAGNHSSSSSSTAEAVNVHIGVLPAMTGVSRFLEKDAPWRYSKVSLTKEQLLLHEVYCCTCRWWDMLLREYMFPTVSSYLQDRTDSLG